MYIVFVGALGFIVVLRGFFWSPFFPCVPVSSEFVDACPEVSREQALLLFKRVTFCCAMCTRCTQKLLVALTRRCVEYRVGGYTRYSLECKRRLCPPRATWGVNDGIAVGAPVLTVLTVDGCTDGRVVCR